MACSHNGLIDSGMKRLRNSSIVAARPPQLSHAQKTPPEVRTSFNGSSQRGQMSAVSVVIGYGLHSQGQMAIAERMTKSEQKTMLASPVRHRHTWSSHSSFLIRASGLF